MNNFFFTKWLSNISISRKLYFTVGIMGLLIAVELATLLFAIRTLSSVRAYVGAEGLWSKAQKDAVYYLEKYAASRNPADYAKYETYLAVPLGDRKARQELVKSNPDFEVVRQGYLEGRFHPDDIDGAVKLITRFHNVSYIARAFDLWGEGDVLIGELQQVADQLHAAISSGHADDASIKELLSRVSTLNLKLTKVEDEFSFTLSEGSRWLTDLIMKLLLAIVLTVEVTGLTITILVSRGIAAGLKEIISSSERIAAGDFSRRVRVHSRDEIGILGNSFNEMTEKLETNIMALKRSEEELSKAKTLAEQSAVTKELFLANMTHELRTPMNAVMGFANLLENTRLDEEQQQFVGAIKVAGNNLLALINDILDYSKIQSGKIIFEQIPVNVRELLNSLSVTFEQKRIERQDVLAFYTDAKVPAFILGDPLRLTQILSNLIDNAIKFTAKGNVEVLTSIKQETADDITLLFRVKDTGTGIAPDKQAIIFDRFTQASPETSRKYGGSGLGLSIVKSLVELQQGTITLQSESGMGSEFAVCLTFKKAAQVAQNLPVEKENKGAAHILVAEDNPLNQMLVVHFSKNHGFDVEVAENGKVAVEKMRAKKFDLILMDIQMPEMDGYEATTIIRNELSASIPIIALTAHAMNGEKEKCLSLGMNDFVTKPFDPKDLYNKISSYLN